MPLLEAHLHQKEALEQTQSCGYVCLNLNKKMLLQILISDTAIILEWKSNSLRMRPQNHPTCLVGFFVWGKDSFHQADSPGLNSCFKKLQEE